MRKVIIVDDEKHCSDRIEMLVANYAPSDLEIMAVCSDVDSAYEAIQKHHPDFIFLDVQINEQTGFDLLDRFDTIDFGVVFATAYEQYAIQAFKVSAVDYLLKPVDPDDFIETLSRIDQRLGSQQSVTDLEVAADNFHHLKHGKLTIATNDGKEIFDIPDIVHCEAAGNYTIFNFKNRKPLKDSRTLKRYDEVLSKHGFFRIHSAHLVNLDYVKRFDNGKNSFVVLKSNEKLPVSTRRKDDFLNALAAYSS